MECKKRAFLLMISLLLLTPFLNIIVSAYSIDFENNSYTIKLSEDGSAVWVIESSTFLNSEEDLRAFMSYVENFNYYKKGILENFTSKIEKILTDVSRYVDRPMEAVDFDISVDVIDTLVGKVGRLTYTFKWIGFSETKDGRLIVGDVFVGGFYLYEGDSLTISIPEDYSFEEVYPQPDKEYEGAATWFGKKLFPDKTPHILASPSTMIEETLTTKTEPPQTSSTTGYTVSPLSDTMSWQPIATYSSIILVIVVGVIVAIFLRGRSERKFTVRDADRVIEVLRRLGGSALQKKIVEETGFSKAKVSEIVSALEKNKVIEKVRVGRSHLIVLKKK
ncbi:MAG: DUF4897 domain-containing protein [Nitrososphaerota archaeon]